MAKFRKKPIVIEAEQYSVERHRADGWLPRGAIRSQVADDDGAIHEGFPYLETIHAGQKVTLTDGDWVIPEADGIHFYPCKPDTFAATYEAVAE